MDWKYVGELALSVAIFAPGLIFLALWVLLRPFISRRREIATATLREHDTGSGQLQAKPVGSATPPVIVRSPVRPVGTTLGDA